MGRKRKRETSEERIERKIRRLEDKLKTRRKRIIYSSEDELECPRDLSSDEASAKVSSEPQIISTFEAAPPTGHDPTPSMPEPTPPMPEMLLPTDIIQQQGSDLPPSASDTSTAIVPTPISEDIQLDDETLLLLGEAPETETTLGKQVHKDLAARWLEILRKGLNKDTKEKLLKEYLIPSNCKLLVSPILNLEVKAALSDNLVKRDASMAARQKYLSVAIAALTQTVDKLISRTEYQALKQDVLKPISDACRILCDMHYFESHTRKKFVINSVNSDLKETLVNSTTDRFLFGENLTDTLKTAKTVQRSADVLKVIHKVNTRSSALTNKSRGNFKSLHQRRPDAAKTLLAPRQQLGYARGRTAPCVTRALPQHPPAPPPPAPRRFVRR